MDQKTWRIVGVIALILGVIALLFSVQAAHKLLEEVYEKTMGHYPSSTRWHMTIGIIMVIGGLVALIFPWKKISSPKKKR
ncbi:MAG: DUF3185 family protein [Chlamydiia bacterium]|nr:DUF3185 family protein [Chlamydiia bacterium]MCP5509029.1 DUF3185 family protein [Chlamydiales bacterium]HPE84929.1 DUF3185 family protein [Chlamydiales bacterium]